MRSILEDCRRLIGPAPRRFSVLDFLYLDLVPPPWLGSRDTGLDSLYSEQRRLRRDGTVAWAAIVQANEKIFEPGESDLPGVVVVALDPAWDDQPAELKKIAGALFDKKETRGNSPELQRLADAIKNEHSQVKGDAAVLGAGLPARISDFSVPRRYLPVPYLAFGFFPVLVLDGLSPLLLPSRFWPPDLRRAWTEGSLEHLRPSAQAEVARLKG